MIHKESRVSEMQNEANRLQTGRLVLKKPLDAMSIDSLTAISRQANAQ